MIIKPLTSPGPGWGDQTFNEMFFASYRYTYPDAKPPVARKTAATTAPAHPWLSIISQTITSNHHQYVDPQMAA